MCMFPAAERAGSLDVAELTAFDVVAMYERPTHAERAHAHPHLPAVAIANSRRAFDHFEALPRRRQTLQRARLRVPAKQLFRGRLDLRSGYEHIRLRHIFFGSPSRAARALYFPG